MEKFDSFPDGRELCRIAKQSAAEKRHVVGLSCLEDESGMMKVCADD